jgi:hypothetical protein
VSPIIAGALILSIHLSGVLLIDFISFLFAITTLLLVRIPFPALTDASNRPDKPQLLREISQGWAYVTSRPGMLSLMLFFTLTNLLIGIVVVLVTPMVLNNASVAALGTLVTIGSCGLLAGGLAMSVWGGPRPRIYGVLGFELLCGLALIAAGARTSLVVLTVSAFVFFFSLQIINGSATAILQAKVALDVQGRVFSLCNMIALSSAPLAYLLAGPLADRVFEPLLSPHGALANTVGQIIGVGPGRGIGFMFIVAGFLTIFLTIAGFFLRQLRNMEEELPDFVLSPVGPSVTDSELATP